MDKDYLNLLFEYKDGNLFWKNDKGKKIKRGQKLGSMSSCGYIVTKIDYKSYSVHRLIFLYHYGYMPKFIDHIDCDKKNNKIENLRECTIQENSYNTKKPKSNSSGIKGVHWCNTHKKWIAKCRNNGERICFGYFSNIKDAENVIKKHRKLIHKEFCNDG